MMVKVNLRIFCRVCKFNDKMCVTWEENKRYFICPFQFSFHVLNELNKNILRLNKFASFDVASCQQQDEG